MRNTILALVAICLGFSLPSCQKGEESFSSSSSNSSVLFFDELSSSANLQSYGADEIKFVPAKRKQDLKIEKIGHERNVIWESPFKKTKSGVWEINYSINSNPFVHIDAEEISTEEISRFSRLIHQAAPVKIQGKDLTKLFGDWSLGGDVFQYRRGNRNANSHGMILSKEKLIKDGALRVKFRFDKESEDDSEFIGLCFRMSQDKTGNVLAFYRSGKLMTKNFEKGETYEIVTWKDGVVKKNIAVSTSAYKPILDANEHTITLFFHNNIVTVLKDNAPLCGPFSSQYLNLREGFVGILTNADLTITELTYADVSISPPGRKEDFTTQDRGVTDPRTWLAMDIKGNKSGQRFEIIDNGDFKAGEKRSIIPGFHERNSHSVYLVLLDGDMSVFHDGSLLYNSEQSPLSPQQELNIFRPEKSRVTVESVKVGEIGEKADFLSTYNRLTTELYYRKIKNYLKFRREIKKGLDLGFYEIRNDTRKAVLVNSPSRMTFPVRIPSRAVLSFGIGVPRECWENSKTILFSIILSNPQKGKKIVFSKEIDVGHFKERKWHDFRVDLSRYSGFVGQIEFKTEAKIGGDEKGASRFALWADPGIFQERGENELNVLLISIDTLRADHLGCYGYGKNISPAIDMIAKEGTMFLNTFSQAPWTAPSHMAVFTSLYPSVFRQSGTLYQLNENFPNIASTLQGDGYYTGAFVSGILDSDYGYNRGYNSYKMSFSSHGSEIFDEYRDVSKWLETHRAEKFFLFFHTFEVHGYPLKGYENIVSGIDPKDKIRQTTALYDNKINIVDYHIGFLTALLKRLGILDNTLIVIMGDHGEELYEHGRLGHAFNFYNELLHVPLIFRLPGKVPANKKIPFHVRSIDIFPTILDILGIENNFPLDGKSLMSFFRGEENKDRGVFSEEPNIAQRPTGLMAVQRDGYKLIQGIRRQNIDGTIYRPYELYWVKNDPKEQTNIFKENNELARKLKDEMKMLAHVSNERRASLSSKKQKQEGRARLSKEAREKLKTLGYLQ